VVVVAVVEHRTRRCFDHGHGCGHGCGHGRVRPSAKYDALIVPRHKIF
jgi:hypothetical protein